MVSCCLAALVETNLYGEVVLLGLSSGGLVLLQLASVLSWSC